MANKIDWEKIRARYITSDITIEQLAEEFNISESTAKKRAAKEKWKAERTKKGKKRAKKIIEKVDTRIRERTVNTINNSLESEAKALEKMLVIVHRILDDEMQFNKHMVTMKYADDMGSRQWTEEQIFSKYDIKQFNALVSSLEKLEKLHRSLGGLVSAFQKSAIEVNLERLAIERERLELQKAKDLGVIDAEEVGVVMLPAVDMELHQLEQEAYLKELESKEGGADE